MKKALGVWVLAFGICAGALGGELELELTGENEVRLDWESIPGQRYNLLATSDLELDPWTNLTPSGVVFSNVIGSCSASMGGAIRFYLVAKPDLDPPTVAELVPAANAVAVATNSTVSITLDDATGIDTQSLVLNVAGWTGLTSSSPDLSWSNNTVTFTPPDALGAPGTTLTNSLTIADTQGHTLSNYVWTFELARAPEVAGQFLSLTAPPASKRTTAGRLRTLPNVRPKDGSPILSIQAVTSNTVVFSYDGTPPMITNGTRLVSFDAAYPFYRAVISNAVDEGPMQITAWTEDISVVDVLDAGSFATVDLSPADAAPAARALKAAGTPLSVDFGGDLSGSVLISNGDLKLWLPECNWSFVGDVDAAADIGWRELKSLDAAAKGKLTLHVKPEVLFYAATSGDSELQLADPATKVFGGMVGIVPVWVTVTMELNAAYEYDTSVSGSVHAMVDMEKELEFAVQLRQKQWSHFAKDSPIVLESEPITWQLEGNAHAKVTFQPKVTILVESLAGVWADFAPYAEMTGQYQLNPLQYDWGLYAGLSANIGIESRVWYGVWGDKPEWELFSQRWPLWAVQYPDTSAAPVFSGPFPHRTVPVGGSVTLAGWATGTPEPQYRWTYNGSRIVGATASEYVIPVAQAGHAGNYAVQAYNSAGSVQASCTVTVTSSSQGGKPRLSWPLPSGNPYTAHCSAVLDHDFTAGRVVAYNGEIGSVNPTGDVGIKGYAKAGGEPFDLALLGGYEDDLAPTSENTHLFYDNHRGYDYPATNGTVIRAAADGRLIAATDQTTANGGIWRNPTVAPRFDGIDYSINWRDYHTFYIVHSGGLSTWYVHANQLSAAVLQSIAANGYADVMRGDLVAYTGAEGTPGSFHLHFTVREITGTTQAGNLAFRLVDPYGDSDTDFSGILWQEQPSAPVDEGDYMVIDLADGSSASSYPVSYLNAVPAGGWSDEYKTTKLVMRRIPAGTFTMGSPTNELGRTAEREAQRQVTLTKDFYVGVFEVTQKQWERVMGTWPSYYFTNASYRETRPVERRSWNSIRGGTWPGGQPGTSTFMARISTRTGLGFDLPTEAQWEYAGRAGTTTALNSGHNLTNRSADARLAEVGRYYYNHPGGYSESSSVSTDGGTAKVGSYTPNAWGLYDMHGNVREWCLDRYVAAPPGTVDPVGAVSGDSRVLRGGGWFKGARDCRSAFRDSDYPGGQYYTATGHGGFRLVRTLQ